MFVTMALCAIAALLTPAISHSIPPRALANDPYPVPKFESDFKKGDTPAQWAPGYPKVWGTEDARYQFNEPEPDDIFSALVTDDEKYVVMSNGSHATFLDIDSNTTISTFVISSDFNETGTAVRASSDGGYDLFTKGMSTSTGQRVYNVRKRHISTSLKPTGQPTTYPGDLRVLQGSTLVTSTAYNEFKIFDVSSTNSTTISLKDTPGITDMSLSSSGAYLSGVSWQERTADLWNATSGAKILSFPATNAQNWATRISPDNKYVAITLGTYKVQVYSLQNLTAPPVVLPEFNDWIRAIEWSPDGKYFAAGDRDRMQLFEFPGATLVQTWKTEALPGRSRELYQVKWVDGGKKLSWVYRYGRYMYDFETNLKYWFTPGYTDHTWADGDMVYLEKRKLVATWDGDSRMRLWKV